MSGASRRPVRRSISPRCPKDRIAMEQAVLQMHFPRGTLPVMGRRCRRCGLELVSTENAQEGQELAEKLGLYEPRFPLVRTITKSGGQLALYLPREIEKALGLSKGTRVRIFTRGDEIIIQPT
jgi:hypothetical protein